MLFVDYLKIKLIYSYVHTVLHIFSVYIAFMLFLTIRNSVASIPILLKSLQHKILVWN